MDEIKRRIKALKVRQSTTFSADGHLIKVLRGDRKTYYAARVDANSNHGRMGNLSEIIEDVQHFLHTGVLPRSERGWFI